MNFYVLLGVRRDATPGDIRRAYRRLARKYHPDLNPGDRPAADLFRRVSLAFETLSDPERRRRYDAEGGEIVSAASTSTFEFQGFDFSATVEETRASTFGELFADAIRERGGVPAVQGAEVGADLHASASISFEQSMRGAAYELLVARLERCGPCAGLGRLPGPEMPCVTCDGHGAVRTVRGHMVFARSCPTCGGGGVVRSRTCGACGGEGVGVHNGGVLVQLPPGLDDGTELVIPGEGHAGRRGGPAGALHVSVSVRPHPYLRRAGDDIHLEVPVAVHEAALGARIEVPTADGPMRMRVPPGTQSGQAFRFRGRGVPRPDGSRGDLLVAARIVLPRLLDERSRELLREFAVRNPEDVRERLFDGGVAPPGTVRDATNSSLTAPAAPARET